MIKKLNKMRAEKGFTLAELLVVVLIIGILATVAIVFFTGQTDTAKDNVATANLRSAYSAAQNLYVTNDGSYNSPSTPGDEQADVEAAIESGNNLQAIDSTAPTGQQVGVDMTNATSGTIRVLSGDGENYLVKTLPGGADSTVPVP